MAYQFDQITVLVIEDNPPMALLTRSILETFGVGRVLMAKNGEDGFAVFCKHNPDIIVADWMMKPVDGIELTLLIRNDPRSPNPFVPVILMTGFSEKHRVMAARDCGVTEFLVKPFRAKDLYKRLAQLVERPRQFVQCENFFGPDRRRVENETFNGPYRRQSDSRAESEQQS